MLFGELCLLLRLLLAVLLLSHGLFRLLLLHLRLRLVLICYLLEERRRESLKEGVILHTDLNLLLGRQILHDWGYFESAGLVVGHEDLEYEVFVGVVFDERGSLHDLSDLESWQVNLVLGEREVGPGDFADVMQFEL